MTSDGFESPQVRVDALAGVYPRLVEALRPLGLTAAELDAVFQSHIAAECVQCGWRLTGEELGQLALDPVPGQAEDPRLARLRRGYCPRKDCTTYYYRIEFTEHPKVDWQPVAAQVAAAATAATAAPVTAAEPAARGSRWWFWEDPKLRRVVIGLAVLAVLLVARHFATGGRVPFVHRSPKYVVDPASVPEAPSGMASPSSTNRSVTNSSARPRR